MGAYLAARRKGYLSQVTAHMLTHGVSISRARTVWTKAICMRSAKSFDTPGEWEIGDRPAYRAAQRNGWLSACTAHMHRRKRVNGYWTRNRCIEEARKHLSIAVWFEANGSSYKAAKANPEWFAECTAHMQRLWERKWSASAILADAKRYSTPQEWSRTSPSAYNAATAKGLVRRATSHMVKNPKWFPVATIHRILQTYRLKYVDEKTFDDCRDKRRLPFDFYLPSLNLLIEHHGTQHQRGWQGRGAEAIQRRDDIKRQYASVRGFAYLEIKEWETSDPAEVEQLIVSKIKHIRPDAILEQRRLTARQIERTNVRGKFTLDEVSEIASRFTTRAAFKRGNEPAYNFACRHGYIDDICRHMLSKSQAQRAALTKWTKGRVLASARKFRTSREWAIHEGSAYGAALREGWVEEASRHFPSRQRSARKTR